MASGVKMSDTQISKRNISYYDEIADDYDAILSKDTSNAMIRTWVCDRFISLVKSGTVLDFGGGTGQDLAWLLRYGYRIIFCEPSSAMRDIAMERSEYELPVEVISFLDDFKTDFRTWTSQFPFEQKVNAVLANFAVINCIPDINTLFEKLALLVEPGGIVFALMLDYNIIKKLRSNLKGTIQSFFSGNTLSFEINYNGERQQVYLHSGKAIKRAVAHEFEYNDPELFRRFGYRLIHLVRK
jgi:SAM-dependent methyltransferase